MSPEARDHSFDELTRGLANGTLSRGKALRLMGAALVGGALASIPGIAWAKPNKPEGAKCKHNHQCESGFCVGGVCRGAAEPICTPSCPEDCACVVTVDGTTSCISCPFGLCRFRLVLSCGECDPVAEVCRPEPPLGEFPFSCALRCPSG
jgi:hypothetical protein